MKKDKIELMAPAGNKTCFFAAVDGGADAVYLGLNELNARRKAKNFSIYEVIDIINYSHKKSIKIYVTFNTLIKDIELNELSAYLNILNKYKVDAVIIQDLGVLHLIKKYYPELTVHASTQMKLHNLPAIRWSVENNIKRVILPRELSKQEILFLRKNTEIELEVFCHGALCYSYSGLCTYSSFLGGASANRGLCAQPCRRYYLFNDKKEYPFTMNDLCLIREIPGLIRMGVDSLKIEGRLRSPEYVYLVTKEYKRVINAVYNNIDDLSGIIESAANNLQMNNYSRSTGTGFYKLDINDDLNSNSKKQTGILIGSINKVNNDKVNIITKKDILENDIVRVYISNKTKNQKSGSQTFKIKFLTKIKKNYYEFTNPGYLKQGMKLYKISSSNKVLDFKILNIFKTKLNKEIFFKSYEKSGFSKFSEKTGPGKNSFYIQFENKGLLYDKNIKFFDEYILLLNYKFVKYYQKFNKKHKVFKGLVLPKNKIGFSLPEIIPDKYVELYKSVLDEFVKAGYLNYFISNIGQVKLFEKYKKINLSANNSIYFSNSLSGLEIKLNSINKICVPLEYGLQDILKLKKYINLNSIIITVFNYPQLFMSKILKEDFKNKNFLDDNNNEITTYYDSEFNRVISKKPFSLLRRIKELNKNGFYNFMIDVRNKIVNKRELKKIISYVKDNKLLKNYSNFNFKTGIK